MTTTTALQPTVYIVDDDQATRKSLRWLVETLGVPVQTFHCAVKFSRHVRPVDAQGAWCST